MEPAPEPSAPWMLLPIDVLVLTFGRLLLRPRISIIALVCRRWRDAVLRSVTCIEFSAPASLFALPSVTALHPTVRFLHQSLLHTPPPWLRSLTYEPRLHSNIADMVHLAGITCLTRLHLNAHRAHCPGSADLVQLIARNAASLTELVYNPSELNLEVAGLLLALRMPNLCSLELHAQDSIAPVGVIGAHASQLTHLSTCHYIPFPLPLCRSVDLDDWVDHFASTVKSVAFTFDISTGDPPDPTFPYSLLSSLSVVRNEALGWDVAEWLCRCTALRNLNMFFPPCPPAAVVALPSQPHLRTLKVAHYPVATVALMHRLQCTKLSELEAEIGVLEELCKNSPWPYPFLRSLTTYMSTNKLQVILTVLQLCSLQKFDVTLLGHIDRDAVVSLLSAACARGVEVVVFRSWKKQEVLRSSDLRPYLWTDVRVHCSSD